MELMIVLAAAFVLDLVLGEPPLPLHPVVWMGKFISLWEKAGLKGKPGFQFAWGLIMTLLTAALFALPVYFLLHFLEQWNTAAFIIVGAGLFKITFSLRELRRAALTIKRLLVSGDLAGARFNLRSLVKRDPKDLAEPLVISAAVESVAENICDSLVAPLFYFLLLGVPGAVAYRAINTLDAMIGMHGKYEYLGKFAARLDDVLNYIPARLTALLIVTAALFLRQNARRSWKTMLSDHSRTESPNAGWPMSAAAGALGVQFTKPHHYCLGRPEKALKTGAIDAVLRLTGFSALIWIFICLLVEAAVFVVRTQA
ncbi:MAG: cobalamin biosynthesis protein [Dehalococcoidales bacterium]|nr:cobalamin biosynthesis protein [Dehalococcoidales bacterium]